VPKNWIEHRRGLDAELLGWMKPVDDGFVVIDLLGRERTEVLDWLEAEEQLESLGMGYLADPYELQLEDGHWLRVRMVEVSVSGIRLKKEDWGDMTAPQVYYTAEFPMPARLRAL
jgi:Lon protease-like protein